MGLRRRNREEIENVFEEMINENFPNLKKETHIQVQKARVCMLVHFSRVQLFVILWTIVHQSPLSMGFSRHEYWSGLPCPPPGDLPDPKIKPESAALQVDSLPLSHWGSPMKTFLLSHKTTDFLSS